AVSKLDALACPDINYTGRWRLKTTERLVCRDSSYRGTLDQEEMETVREAEDHSVSVPHVQTEADREIMAEDRSQERMMIPRIRTAVREETAAEPSIRALQAIQ
ncbi:MAG TPA: hypothetical protein PKY04_10160, partial [Fusicatenibacter saccharivorans]|nr:hypothetical protein [Fusicatenibacter saccharivorans]